MESKAKTRTKTKCSECKHVGNDFYCEYVNCSNLWHGASCKCHINPPCGVCLNNKFEAEGVKNIENKIELGGVISKLSIQKNDILLLSLSEKISGDEINLYMTELRKLLDLLGFDTTTFLAITEGVKLECIPETIMNNAGWYRKE